MIGTVPYLKGGNGTSIPALGLGTYGMSERDLSAMLPAALRAGLRHIDTAQIYHNEDAIGGILAAMNVSREEVFLTTKMWVSNYKASRFMPSLDESLRRLRTDYVDLLLLHWPNQAVPLEEQIAGLIGAYEAGKARYIGVSNFNSMLVREAVRLSPVALATNQFEFHPYLNQQVIADATQSAGLVVTAYCAMAVGRVFDDPILRSIAASVGRTVPQVVLRWLLQQGVATLTRSTNPARIAENIRIHDFSLSDEAMATIASLAESGSRIVNPLGLAPAWDATPGVRRIRP